LLKVVVCDGSKHLKKSINYVATARIHGRDEIRLRRRIKAKRRPERILPLLADLSYPNNRKSFPAIYPVHTCIYFPLRESIIIIHNNNPRQ